MDQIMGKAGGYWFNQQAGKEMNNVGDELNSISSSIGDGAKWMVNKIKGKMQKPFPELLKEYDLSMGLFPIRKKMGLFPQDATNYEFDEETKKLMVHIASACEVGYKDSLVLRFFTCVTGNLDKGKLSEVEGIKTKILIWIKVTAIRTEASKVHFCAGLNNTWNRHAYEVVRDGVSIDKF
ncbi:hypothetical protein TRIUR3_33980 [Triticum urartu]|uniref:Uncharacterized protein n=1 Tax=Triticum urartu TaxID=4572 RepID=M7YVW7_TRIUA|nr:uncharacterized protein At5g01610-like [Triticum urartu]EMS51737.1 hypothetical protein TRIUR3_33980 [Triticum urartu]